MKIAHYLLCVTITIISLSSLSTQAATTTATQYVPRIVGGKVSTPEQWPWMMALVYKNSNPYKGQFCGASLISPRWVVTAAHCVERVSQSEFNVVAHLFDLKNDQGHVITVKRIIRHPSYNINTLENDIVLLQLQEPVSNAKVLPLVIDNSSLVNINATVIGWGALSENDSNEGIYPELLYEATLPIVSNTLCKKRYGSRISSNMLCAGFSGGGVDTCQGDSGGPLIIQQNGKWRLAGITSNGIGCARPRYYGVYTRVSKYLDFINTTVKTKYILIADANHDTVINALDKTMKSSELQDQFQYWISQCWIGYALCADMNSDGVIDQRDYDAKEKSISDTYHRWLSIYWQPESN